MAGQTTHVKCLICGQLMKAVTPMHLASHHISLEDYIREFGDPELKSMDVRIKELKNRGYRSASQAELIEAIRHAFEKRPKTCDTAWFAQSDPVLLARAMEVFGSWQAAMLAAGIDPAGLKQIKWHPDFLVGAVREFEKTHGVVKPAMLREHDPNLAGEVHRRFKSFITLKVFGIQVELAQRRWTEELVLDTIRQVVKGGVLPSRGQLNRRYPGLYCAAVKRFGSFVKALEAAGTDLRPDHSVKWPKKKVLDELKKLADAGVPMNSSSVMKKNYPLHRAAFRFFRTWPEVLAAIGIKHEPRNKSWSKAKIVEALRNRKKAGLSLRYVDVKAEDGQLRAAIGPYFGSYRKAMRAAGLEIERLTEQWDKDRVIRELKELATRHPGLNSCRLAKLDRKLHAAVPRLFTGFKEAFEIAGLTLSRKIPWTQERVISQIKKRIAHSRALDKKSVRNCSVDLVEKGEEYFGSWENAVTAARQ